VSALSRAEGYRRGRGKEEPTLRAAEALLAAMGLVTRRIRGADENRRLGDLRVVSSKRTVEVKTLSMDPRYSTHLVELYEDTRDTAMPYHREGFGQVAAALDMQPSQLARQGVRRAGPVEEIGRVPYASNSLESIVGSDAALFMDGLRRHDTWSMHLSGHLLARVRSAVLHGSALQGAGNCNEKTVIVRVPHPPCRGTWAWREQGRGWVSYSVFSASALEQVVAHLRDPRGR
jgi:hypothetical protein